jgi:hypothetical protein
VAANRGKLAQAGATSTVRSECKDIELLGFFMLVFALLWQARIVRVDSRGKPKKVN